jgi:hypothetical protein
MTIPTAKRKKPSGRPLPMGPEDDAGAVAKRLPSEPMAFYGVIAGAERRVSGAGWRYR